MTNIIQYHQLLPNEIGNIFNDLKTRVSQDAVKRRLIQ